MNPREIFISSPRYERGALTRLSYCPREEDLTIQSITSAMLAASPSDLVTKAANALNLWCPSSKAALLNPLSASPGTKLTRPLSQVILSPTHVVTRPSLHEELPRRSLFAQFRSKRYECIASTVELRHPSNRALHYAVASNLAGTQQNRTVVRPSAPYKAGLSYLLGIFSHAVSSNGNRFYTHNRHR